MRYWSFYRESKLQQKSITTQQLEAGGVHKANEEEGGSTGGENQITSTAGETLTLISAVRHCVVTFEF